MLSLSMVVTVVDGVWLIEAPWLDAPVEGPTFEAAYDAAVRLRKVR